MKIVATSDFHGELPAIPECELLLIAGDVCPDGSNAFQASWLGGPFRKWLEEVPAKEIVLVAGNHDQIFEKEKERVPAGLRCHYLEDSAVELFGFTIYGTPWQLPFWGAFNLTEEGLSKKYALIPSKVDILISHSPPYCIADAVGEFEEVVHTGSVSLRKKVFELKPKLFICGHIHCAYGVFTIQDIVFANVSLLDDDMIAAHEPVVFHL